MNAAETPPEMQDGSGLRRRRPHAAATLAAALVAEEELAVVGAEGRTLDESPSPVLRFPDGPRHDLGLYELPYTVLVLVPAVVVLNRRRRPAGTSVAVLALLCAPVRFLGDFLRNTDLPGADVRYLGPTVGQYGCLVLAGVGIFLAMRLHGRAPGRLERP